MNNRLEFTDRDGDTVSFVSDSCSPRVWVRGDGQYLLRKDMVKLMEFVDAWLEENPFKKVETTVTLREVDYLEKFKLGDESFYKRREVLIEGRATFCCVHPYSAEKTHLLYMNEDQCVVVMREEE